MMLEPMLAANAAVFAIKNATVEGKITVIVLLLLSLFSWTIILGKFRQLLIARAATKKNFWRHTVPHATRWTSSAASRSLRGAPAYQLYIRGADELVYQLKNNPVSVAGRIRPVVDLPPGMEKRAYRPCWQKPTSRRSASLRLTRCG